MATYYTGCVSHAPVGTSSGPFDVAIHPNCFRILVASGQIRGRQIRGQTGRSPFLAAELREMRARKISETENVRAWFATTKNWGTSRLSPDFPKVGQPRIESASWPCTSVDARAYIGGFALVWSAGESPASTRAGVKGSGQECPLYTVRPLAIARAELLQL